MTEPFDYIASRMMGGNIIEVPEIDVRPGTR